nr:Fe-only nitrogenase subunit delta [uncultured Desulfuromonas sp.]
MATHKINNMAERKYEKVYTSDPLAKVDADTKEKIGALEHYIMKHCLWQFNSRGWDRRKQNAGILGKTTQLLCGEEVENATPQEKCYWTDAVMLQRAYQERCPWINEMSSEEIKTLMQLLNARLDWTLIDGSLNLELTVVNY